MDPLTATGEMPSADSISTTGFTINGRTVNYSEPLEAALWPTLRVGRNDDGKEFLRWSVAGKLAQGGFVAQGGTVWDGKPGWWRKPTT